MVSLLGLPLLFGLAAPAAAQTISLSTLFESNNVITQTSTPVTVSGIPSNWTAPVSHSLTTTGTGSGHATLAAASCQVEGGMMPVRAFDVCDFGGIGYDAGNRTYELGINAQSDSVSDSGETFNVVLTDSSMPPKSATFTMTVKESSDQELDISVADAYEGESIVVTLELEAAPGNVAERSRTLIVTPQVPSSGEVAGCITDSRCEAGTTPAAASAHSGS